MKKILVMSFGSDAGGIEKSLIEFLKFLVQEGHMVELYLWRKPGVLFNQIPNEVNVRNEKLYPGSIKEVGECGFLVMTKQIIWYIVFRVMQMLGYPTKVFKKINSQYDIAVAYCQNGYTPYYVIDKVDADEKLMWYHHGSYENGRCGKNRDERYYRKYNRLVTVSEANRRMLERHFPTLKGKIDVIGNLCNEQAIREKAKLPINERIPNVIKIVTVGRIAQEKGQIFALDVARKLKDRGLEFIWIFVGDGPQLEICKTQAERLGIASECRFVGVKENPYPYMRIADVYVQPSEVEADPITIKEALILGKIIVASNIDAICESLICSSYGYTCNRDVDEFSDTILRVLPFAMNGNVSDDNNVDTCNLRFTIQSKIRRLLGEGEAE